MTMAGSAPKKRYGLFSLAILLLVVASYLLFVEPYNFALLTVALVAMIGSVRLARASNVRAPPSSPVVGEGVDDLEKTGPSSAQWRVGEALLLLTGATYYLLRQDALHGGHEVFPLYLFAGAALVCGSYWGYLISKLFR